MGDNEAHNKLIAWLNFHSPHRVTEIIKSHQSGSRPQLPYLMVNLLNVREVNEDYEPVVTYSQDKTKASPQIEMEWEFSISAYADNPSNFLRWIKAYQRLAQKQEPMFPNLVIHETGSINIVPDWIQNAWEPRAHMNITLRGIVRDQSEIDTIDEINIDINED